MVGKEHEEPKQQRIVCLHNIRVCAHNGGADRRTDWRLPVNTGGAAEHLWDQLDEHRYISMFEWGGG